MVTSNLHEKILKEYINELSKEGYKVIDLERKSPDAIAIKDGKIYAVEILARQYKKGKGWSKKWTFVAKKKIYHMFDDVLIRDFKHPLKKGDRFVSDGNYKELLSENYKKNNGKKKL